MAQLTEWLQEETGDELADLRKDTVTRLLKEDNNSAKVRRMLVIRQELGKTSTKKYDAIEAAVCEDGRVRGLLQFYGANRAGRWAGRLVQVQNLPVITQGRTVGINSLILSREYDYNQGTDCMTITLSSGRKLYYVSSSIGQNQWDKPSIAYMGMDQKTKRWKRIETYGGKLVENCVQAIARDCLADTIERLEAAGLPVIFHVHDEVVIDITPWADNDAMLDLVCSIMRTPISWAPDLPLNADGWVGHYFRKD